jgi:hypothetical protein
VANSQGDQARRVEWLARRTDYVFPSLVEKRARCAGLVSLGEETNSTMAPRIRHAHHPEPVVGPTSAAKTRRMTRPVTPPP